MNTTLDIARALTDDELRSMRKRMLERVGDLTKTPKARQVAAQLAALADAELARRTA